MKMADIHVLDLKKILERTLDEFPNKSNQEILEILNRARINQKRFKFVFLKRFYILCPKCKGNKLALYRKENIFRCRDCWNLKYKAPRKSKNNRGKIYSRYVRPLEKLRVIEQKLFLDDLTDQMRIKLEKQAAVLRKAIPEYMLLMREEVYKILEGDDDGV